MESISAPSSSVTITFSPSNPNFSPVKIINFTNKDNVRIVNLSNQNNILYQLVSRSINICFKQNLAASILLFDYNASLFGNHGKTTVST